MESARRHSRRKLGIDQCATAIADWRSASCQSPAAPLVVQVLNLADSKRDDIAHADAWRLGPRPPAGATTSISIRSSRTVRTGLKINF